MVTHTVVLVAAIVAPVAIVAAFYLLRFCRDVEGALHLFTLTHGMICVVVELTSVMQRAVEFALKEGRPSQCIGHVDLAKSLAQPDDGVRRTTRFWVKYNTSKLQHLEFGW
jgi:hypothetical protein